MACLIHLFYLPVHNLINMFYKNFYAGNYYSRLKSRVKRGHFRRKPKRVSSKVPFVGPVPLKPGFVGSVRSVPESNVYKRKREGLNLRRGTVSAEEAKLLLKNKKSKPWYDVPGKLGAAGGKFAMSAYAFYKAMSILHPGMSKEEKMTLMKSFRDDYQRSGW